MRDSAMVDAAAMDISGVASMTIQANALDAVRTTLDAARAAPPTQSAQAGVILSLSTAASSLMTGGGSSD
jgi:hypothetical protein